MTRPKKSKIIGSVAVDSQTGIEHYGVPKGAYDLRSQYKGEEAISSKASITPSYGSKTTGEVNNLAGVPEEFMNLFEHDPSEIILKQALKHSSGGWLTAALTVLAVSLVGIGTMALIFDSKALGVSDLSDTGKAIGAFISLLICTLIVGMSFIFNTVYRKSRLILTNQKLVYIQYHSLFSREVSQLNIAEVEDVNVAQHSIWDRIFKMGTITIETAGEQNSYVFTHVANPHDFARLTIQAHEGSIAEYGN